MPCPMTKPRIINKNNPWWTDQLQEMRKEIHTIYDKMKAGTITREIYKKKLRRLKEQKKDKKRIQEIIENEAEMAKHVKYLSLIHI